MKPIKPIKPKFRGIILEVALLFAAGTLAIGLFTYFTQQVITDSSVKNQMETIASSITEEMSDVITEYPSYRWLISYWRDHPDDMDIEYDVDYSSGTRTEAKAKLLQEHHPDLQLKYVRPSEVERFSAEDQKLYAEVAYSWMITEINQIKRANNAAFLFCVMTDSTYEHQFFLLSAADPGAVRGTNYEEVYTLGVAVDVSPTQQEGMQLARENRHLLAAAGDYVDYYAYVDTIQDEDVMIGLTYDLSMLNRDIQSLTWRGTIFAVILEMILAWVFLGVIYRVALQPLQTIQENIRLYMNTKNSEEVCKNLEEVRPPNEIGQLSVDICDLTREVDDYLERISRITEERERIKVELSLATAIQANMLPNTFPAFPDRTEFDIFASMDPAREIGGDFYDYFLIDEDHLCLFIADVSGKGIPAAMFMMASQIILKDNASGGKSPAQIMESANAMICSNNKEDMFVTVWLGILEISTGKLAAVNAGHEYPAVSSKGRPFELVKDKHSLLVGGMEGIKYKEYEIDLEPGDKIFVYTDGVPEATNPETEMFGTERMIAALNEPADTPRQIAANVRKAVDEFTSEAEQFDDLTMLCLEYKGKAC